MKKNLSQLLQSKGIMFYQSDRISLDYQYFEPYQDSNMKFEPGLIFETDPIKEKRFIMCAQPSFSLFHYFLDGSRKPYKIGDMVTRDNKFVPVVVGQIRAGCCKRNQACEIKEHRLDKRNVLMMYEGIQVDDFQAIKESIEKPGNMRVPITVEKYRFSKKEDRDPTYAAVSKIQDIMQQMEIDLLGKMVNSNDLDTDQMLVVDGTIKFIKHRFDKRIFYNVIGISKSFNPNLTGLTRGNQHIGTKLTSLGFGERTPVFYTKAENGIGYGVWYLRIRHPEHVRNKLDGIVKVEKMATDNDNDIGGLDSTVVDNISASILFERNPTSHGNDLRWANHLYPIYLTEKMLKTSFLSDTFFMNIF